MALINVASIAGHQFPSALAPKRLYKRALTNTEQFYIGLAGRMQIDAAG